MRKDALAALCVSAAAVLWLAVVPGRSALAEGLRAVPRQ